MEKMVQTCAERSEAFRRMTEEQGGLTLTEFLDLQRKKLSANRSRTPLLPREDVLRVCRGLMEGVMAPREVESALACLATTAMHTADHLGGLYSPQSFQGDLLFQQLLRREGLSPEAVPILACGCVSLGAETYSRGIMTFTGPEGARHLPLFSMRQINCAVSLMGPLTEEQVRSGFARAGDFIPEEHARRAVEALMEPCYLTPAARSASRFAEQLLPVGLELTRSVLASSGLAPFAYLEAEALWRELLLSDLADTDALPYAMLWDEALVNILKETRTPEGRPLSALLFRGADGRGRSFALNLVRPGRLEGRTVSGEPLSLRFDRESLRDLLQERRLLCGAYLGCVLLCLLRGYTWMGGEFQTVYLPRWQQLTAEALRERGWEALAEKLSQWDLSGCISGPVFALYGEGSWAVHAGPVEFALTRPGPERWAGWLDTRLADAQCMGLFEIYHDLVCARERTEGWYETIAACVAQRYPQNLL